MPSNGVQQEGSTFHIPSINIEVEVQGLLSFLCSMQFVTKAAPNRSIRHSVCSLRLSQNESKFFLCLPAEMNSLPSHLFDAQGVRITLECDIQGNSANLLLRSAGPNISPEHKERSRKSHHRLAPIKLRIGPSKDWLKYIFIPPFQHRCPIRCRILRIADQKTPALEICYRLRQHICDRLLRSRRL